MEKRDLYEDDLTEERLPTPAQRDDVAHTLKMDPDVEHQAGAEETDDDDEDDEDDDEDEDLNDELDD